MRKLRFSVRSLLTVPLKNPDQRFFYRHLVKNLYFFDSEGNSSRRPGRRRIVCIIRRYTLNISAVRIHDIEVVLSFSIGAEDNLPARRRPGRVLIAAWAVREEAEIRTVRIHRSDLKQPMDL